MDVDLPPELEAALSADPAARALFDARSTRDRTDDAAHVAGAKQAETRIRRAAKVVERLHAREATLAERRERGTADLGKRFDRLFVAAASPALKAAGFRRVGSPRRWERRVGDRLDDFLWHRMGSLHPEFAQFRFEAAPSIDVGGRETMVELHEWADDDDVAQQLADIIDRYIAAADVAVARPVRPVVRDPAIRETIQQHVAERHRLAKEHSAPIRELLGPRYGAANHSGSTITVSIVRPTDADAAAIREITGPDWDLVIDPRAVTMAECNTIVDRLRPVLLERERADDDLVAFVSGWGIAGIMVEAHHLDPETERIIRAAVPEAALVLTQGSEALARLQKRDRLART